jgi:hypothetical protein
MTFTTLVVMKFSIMTLQITILGITTFIIMILGQGTLLKLTA